jgi:hypothetical protein
VTVEFGADFRKTLTSPKSRRVAIFFSPSPQGDEDEELYEKNAEMNEVDGVIISSIHRITGNEYFKQLFLRQSQNCFSARSAKEPSTQKSRLWDFLPKMGRFSPLQGQISFPVFFFKSTVNECTFIWKNNLLFKVTMERLILYYYVVLSYYL